MSKKQVPTLEEINRIQGEIDKYKSISGFSYLELNHTLQEYLERGYINQHSFEDCVILEGSLDDETINLQMFNNILKIEIVSDSIEKQIIRYLGNDASVNIVVTVTNLDKKQKNAFQKSPAISRILDTVLFDSQGIFIEEQIFSDVMKPIGGVYDGFEPYIRQTSFLALENKYVIEINEIQYYNEDKEKKVTYKKHKIRSEGETEILEDLDSKSYSQLVQDSAMGRRRKKKNTEK